MKALISRLWWMGILGVVALGILLLSGIWGLGQPRLVVHGDLGTFYPGQATERVILIENPGVRDVVLLNVRTCCGVSLPYDFPRKIPARATVGMIVSIVGFDQPLEKTIALETDARRNPLVDCTLRAKPDLSVPYSDDSIKVDDVVVGQTLTPFWTVSKGTGRELACTAVCDSPYVVVLPQKVDGNGNVTFSVQISEDAPRGELTGYLFTTTGVPKRPTLSTRFEIYVDQGVKTRPKNVFFGVVKDEGMLVRQIDVELLQPGWDTVELAPLPHECLDAQVIGTSASNKYSLRVSLDPVKMPRKLDTNLTLSNGKGDSLQVPVLAIRAPADAQDTLATRHSS